ncbi:hypothetical protein M0R04_14590 [Candidatus Dojkabacteria bacterium]|jgi:hypothetical protein|nr:hypothetical protein [Candidatus Dojkabacteria bacterium]
MVLEAMPFDFKKIIMDWVIGTGGDSATIFILVGVLIIAVMAAKFRMTGYTLVISEMLFIIIMISMSTLHLGSVASGILIVIMFVVAIIGARYMTPQ